MSGINEIKQKTKMSIDEMFDNQPVGLTAIQIADKPKIKQSINTVNLQKNQPDNNSLAHKNEQPIPHTNTKEEIQPYTTTFPSNQRKSPKVQTYKMTFILAENSFKAFNDLYAHLMLQGRKTEKSELICRAIQLLVNEEQQKQQQINTPKE